MNRYSCYEYEIRKCGEDFEYVIYDPRYITCSASIIEESRELFSTAQEANFAAIGHIDLLENGENIE